MAAQQGRALLIKVGDGGGTEVFTTVAGLRQKSIKLNNTTVDVTNSDSSNAWRELLEGAGIKSFSVSGSGVFKDSASEATLRTLFVAGTHRNFQITIPDFYTVTGKFNISELAYEGTYDGEVTYNLTLDSANEPAFAAI